LYVSQQQTTGLPAAFDIIATVALPARENIAPFDIIAAAPSSVRDTLERTDPTEDSKTYVQGISAANRERRRFLPSCIGLESTMMTEKRLPCSLAARSTPSTRDDLTYTRSTSACLIWKSALYLPSKGEDHIIVLDFAEGEVFNYLACEYDTITDEVVYPLAQQVPCLSEQAISLVHGYRDMYLALTSSSCMSGGMCEISHLRYRIALPMLIAIGLACTR